MTVKTECTEWYIMLTFGVGSWTALRPDLFGSMGSPDVSVVTATS